MSDPLGVRRKRLDNLLQNTVEEHNQQANELLGVFQRDFPRTYRLLDGPHFQLPARREADYPHYRYAVYDNARTFISATTQLAGRSGLDVDAWCRMRGECQVLNEWMKRGTTTLFVERVKFQQRYQMRHRKSRDEDARWGLQLCNLQFLSALAPSLTASFALRPGDRSESS